MFKAVLPAAHLNVVARWKCLGDDTFVVEGLLATDFKGIDEASIGASIRLSRSAVAHFSLDEEHTIM
jgi:hypothetical protein